MSSDRLAVRAHDSAPSVLAAVAAGGALGACLRAAVGQLAPASDAAFPWSTFWINVCGSGLLALLPALAAVRRRPLLRPFLGTGVLGGFTTLSAWSQETHDLLAEGRTALALTYAAATLVACLLAVTLGERIAVRGQRHESQRPEDDR